MYDSDSHGKNSSKQKRMNIAFFTFNYPPLSVFGVERHNERLANHLASKSHFVLIFTRGHPRLPKIQCIRKGVLIYRLPSTGLLTKRRIVWIIPVLEYTLFSLILAPKLIKKHRIHVVCGSGSYYGGWQAAITALLTRRPSVITLHGYAVDYYKGQKMPKIYSFLRWATAIIVQKTSSIKTLAQWKIPKQKIFYIEQGAIDTKKFKPPIQPPTKSQPYITFVGRLIKFKGPELLVEAAPKILQEKPDVTFLFVGEGNLKTELEKKVKTLGIEEKTKFLGIIHDVERVYQKSDVFVALSPYNNFSDLAMLEAMACGVPVIATNAGETKKTIKDGWNGLLVEPGNVKQLVEKTLLILNDHHLAEELSKNARKTIKEKYNLEKFGNETLQVYCLATGLNTKGEKQL